jgi:hypothetical protein
MRKHGTFPKEGESPLPYSPFLGVPHDIVDIEEYAVRQKEDKQNCADIGRCNECLNGTCRIIMV